MSKKIEHSIYDGLEHIYAEQLRGKRVALTIKAVTGGAEFFHEGRKTVGYNVEFTETPLKLGVTGATVRRQLFMATGTEDADKMAGKKIVLYPVKSTRSATGEAIRVAKYEGKDTPAPKQAPIEPPDSDEPELDDEHAAGDDLPY